MFKELKRTTQTYGDRPTGTGLRGQLRIGLDQKTARAFKARKLSRAFKSKKTKLFRSLVS